MIFLPQSHRGHREKNNLAGGCSPRPPKSQKKILGVLGVKPLARPISLCVLCGSVVKNPISSSKIYSGYLLAKDKVVCKNSI